MLGNGSGGFSTHVNYPASISPNTIAKGDFNGDGNADLVVQDFISNNLAILLNNGSGIFSAPSLITTGTDPEMIVCADFNADGNTDIVGIATTGSTGIFILNGNGSGSFSAPVTMPISNDVHFIASADFNADGKPDIAITEQNNLNIYLGNGTGGFLAPNSIAITGYLPKLICKDFNTDGKMDIAVCNYTSSNIAVLLGNGSGGFFAPTTFGTNIMPSSVGSGDFDNDGNIDLIVTQHSYMLHTMNLLTGNGSGSFASPVNIATTRSVISADGTDLNNDGKDDLVVLYDSSVSTSIPEKIAAGNELTVYPNPNNGLFYISEKLEQNSVVTIYNITGQAVAEAAHNTSGKTMIDIQNQPKGVYFYFIKKGAEVIKRGKLIVE